MMLKLTPEEVSHLEDFIENERLANAVATLSIVDKMVLYQYYFAELIDVEIGSKLEQTSQGVGKRRRQSLMRIKDAYEKV